jgi:KDO2-lipid IV(A) lauroyltransferase
MMPSLRYYAYRASVLARRGFNTTIGTTTAGLMRVARLTNRKRLANVIAAFMRRIGPWLPEHRVGRDNLKRAFPDKSEAEIDALLISVWDNLGRVAAEFVHLDRFTLLRPGETGDFDIVYDDASLARMLAIREKPVARVLFAAHLGNWELPAVVGHAAGLKTSILYRPPSLHAVSDSVLDIRAGCMGTLVASGFDAPIRLAQALDRGETVAMLLDQHERRGVDVTFFGRPCKTTPLLAQLARHFDCPIHGLRVIRLANGNTFKAELTDPIEPVRDAEGKIEIAGTTQRMTSIIEGWVREYPDQWLWLHRRWR